MEEIHTFHFPRAEKEGGLRFLEVEPDKTLVVGIIGPSGMGKNKLVEALGVKGEVKGSIGGELLNCLVEPRRPEVRKEFVDMLSDKGIEYEEEGVVYRGEELARLTEERFGKVPVPQPVIGAIFEELIEKGKRVLPGSPRCVEDLEYYEEKFPKVGFVIIYLSPAGEIGKWREGLAEGYGERGRVDDLDENALSDKERQWRQDVPALLKYIHEKGYPMIHVSVGPVGGVDSSERREVQVERQIKEIASRIRPKLEGLISEGGTELWE
jgi:hypothetical protein